MRGQRPAKKTHHPHTGVRRPFCPERFFAQARGSVSQRNMVGAGDHHRRHRGIPDIQKQSTMVAREWAV